MRGGVGDGNLGGLLAGVRGWFDWGGFEVSRRRLDSWGEIR
jgi:hypothetical protein